MNEKEHNILKELAAAYSLGALDDKELDKFKEHLDSGCEECRQIVLDMQEVSHSIGFENEEVEPPKHLKQEIMKEIGIEETDEDDQEFFINQIIQAKNLWKRLSFGLGFALFVVLGISMWNYISMDNDLNILQTRLDINEQLITQLESEIKQKEEILNTLSSPQLKFVDLKGLEIAPESKGRVLLDPSNKKAIFYAYNLGQAPKEKDYQLWMLKGSKPISAGVFSIDEKGVGTIRFKTIPETKNLTAFAVTLEPKGGVEQPTGDMYLLGKLTEI